MDTGLLKIHMYVWICSHTYIYVHTFMFIYVYIYIHFLVPTKVLDKDSCPSEMSRGAPMSSVPAVPTVARADRIGSGCLKIL